jgi:hypothetical protein
MLDYGFTLYESVALCGEGSIRFNLPVVGGVCDSVEAYNAEELTVSLPSGHGEITEKTELPRFIYAGQKADVPIGKTRFFCDGKEIGSVSLYMSGETAKKETKRGFFGK